MTNDKYRYFYYSREQVKEKNEILGVKDKEYKCGYVVVNGRRRTISQITSNKESMDRYIDAVLICEGEESNFTFIKPETIMRKKAR